MSSQTFSTELHQVIHQDAEIKKFPWISRIIDQPVYLDKKFQVIEERIKTSIKPLVESGSLSSLCASGNMGSNTSLQTPRQVLYAIKLLDLLALLNPDNPRNPTVHQKYIFREWKHKIPGTRILKPENIEKMLTNDISLSESSEHSSTISPLLMAVKLQVNELSVEIALLTAAANLGYYLETGNIDIPSRIALTEYLEKKDKSTDLYKRLRPTFFGGLGRFKQALHVAITYSPILLLSGTKFAQSLIPHTNFLKMMFLLGNQHPLMLLQISSLIMNTIVQLATETVSLKTTLSTMYHGIAALISGRNTELDVIIRFLSSEEGTQLPLDANANFEDLYLRFYPSPVSQITSSQHTRTQSDIINETSSLTRGVTGNEITSPISQADDSSTAPQEPEDDSNKTGTDEGDGNTSGTGEEDDLEEEDGGKMNEGDESGKDDNAKMKEGASEKELDEDRDPDKDDTDEEQEEEVSSSLGKRKTSNSDARINSKKAKTAKAEVEQLLRMPYLGLNHLI